MPKRNTAIILIVISLLFSLLTSCNRTYNTYDTLTIENETSKLYKELPIEYINDIFDISINENGNLVAADKDIIHIYNIDGDLKAKISNNLSFCTKITSDNMNIWAWDSTQNELLHFDNEGNLIKKCFTLSDNIVKVMCINNTLFILSIHKNGKHILYEYSNENIQKIPIENVISMCPYKDEYLFLVIQTSLNDIKIITYNYKTQAIENEVQSSAIVFNDIYYSSKDNYIYFTSMGKLSRLSTDGKSQKLILDFSDKESVLSKLYIWNSNVILLDSKNSKIYLSNIALSSKIASHINEIKIISYKNNINIGNQINIIMKNVKDKYPNSSFVFEYIERNEYYDKLKTMLMSGENSFDAFYLESQNSTYFIKNNVMHDLSEYKFISDRFAECFDKILNLCTYENRIFAVPMDISINVLVYNNEFAQRLGIEIPPFGWDWNGFYSTAKNIKDNSILDNVYILECSKDFFSIFLGSYFCENIDMLKNKVNLKDEKFKTILQIYKKLYDENLILGNNIPVKFNDNTLLFLSSFPTDNTNIIPLPTFSKYQVDMQYLCVNKLSDKKEISAYFISNYLNKDVYNKDAHIKPFFNDIGIYKDSLSQEKIFKIYGNILKNANIRHYSKDLFTFISQTIDDFLNEKITIDQALILMQQKADLILNE